MSVESTVWGILYNEIKNPYGVAGLMGNLKAESSMNPLCKTGGNKNEKGVDYAEKIDLNKISDHEFAHDGVAFGLAQWRYWSRKEQLLIFAKECGCLIGDLEMQVAFLLKEIKTYKTVWETLLYAPTVKEASDIVMERYEKPGNISEAAKEKRAKYGEEYLKMFTTPITTAITVPERNLIIKSEMAPIVITTVSDVNYRCGNGKQYSILGRAKEKGSQFEYVATSTNGWHAIVVIVNHKKRVAWMSNEFCELRLV